jgi:hypothetical protein
LNNPSKIAELQELEQWRTKFDVASAATDGFFSKRWVATNLFNISESEYLRNQRELAYDKLMQAEFDLLDGEGGEAAAMTGGGLGSLGGLGDTEDMGGDLDAGAEEVETGTETETPEEPEGNLLAVPGNRDDDVERVEFKGRGGKTFTTTSNSKGKIYEPRNDLSGKRAVQRSMKSMGGMRGITGVPKGYNDMKRLSRGVSEDLEPNYDIQEQQILDHNNEIKSLITELENKKDVKQN